MPSAERTITINRPIADVFAFFADAENDPQWRGAVKEIKRDGPLQVGPAITRLSRDRVAEVSRPISRSPNICQLLWCRSR